MKKIFRYAMMFAIGALVVVACKKTPKPQPVGPDDPDDPTEQKVNDIKITLDGSFSDWDAITAEVAKKNEFVDMKAGASDDPIQMFKVSSDADNIYFYIEFLADLLPQNDICSTWGDSYMGTPEGGYKNNTDGVNDNFREVMHLFMDPDGNGNTGFLTFAGEDGEEAAIPELGCESCAQFFMFYKPSTKLVSVAWEQTIIGPTNVGNVGDNDQVDAAGYTGPYDYNGTLCQSWPDSGAEAAFPLWGWQNPDNSGKGDNDCPKPENWKPAPAQGNIAKVEFCVEKGDIYNLKDEDEEFACGIIFDWGGSYQAIGTLRVAYSE